MEALTTLPFPEDPILGVWASVLNDAGHWAYVLDSRWQVVFATDELRLTFGDTDASTCVPLGSHYCSAAMEQFKRTMLGGSYVLADFRRKYFQRLGPYVLATTPGGRESLRGLVDQELADLVAGLQPNGVPRLWSFQESRTGRISYAGAQVVNPTMWLRVDDDRGNFGGIVQVSKPAAGMSQLAAAANIADLGHLERMRRVEHPARRPTAILMADLEASSPLTRRLSTAQYFAFVRRLVRAADQCIVDEGGIVGRHAGDGVVAFFLAETAGSESVAARSCITAARALRDTLGDIATRSDIPATDISVRFGLHWGATLYVGRILTAGRSEVTALGDEVNEASRIEACATGGRVLASKSLIERLDPTDAVTLGIDTTRTAYTPLADLATATEKARRDAPAIAVCDLALAGN